MARKPGLGKGLGALIPEGEAKPEANETEETHGPLRTIAVTSIRPNPFQPRKSFNDESLATLASGTGRSRGAPLTAGDSSATTTGRGSLKTFTASSVARTDSSFLMMRATMVAWAAGSVIARRERAWPAVISELARAAWATSPSWRSRNVFVIFARLLPTRWATCSCVRSNSSISCWYAAASSSG